MLVSKLVLNSQRDFLTQGNPLMENIMQGHCISARKLARVSHELKSFISAINLRYYPSINMEIINFIRGIRMLRDYGVLSMDMLLL